MSVRAAVRKIKRVVEQAATVKHGGFAKGKLTLYIGGKRYLYFHVPEGTNHKIEIALKKMQGTGYSVVNKYLKKKVKGKTVPRFAYEVEGVWHDAG